GRAGPRGGDGHADLPRRAGVTVGHVRCALLVAHEDMPHRIFEHRVVGGHDGAAGVAEHDLDAFGDEGSPENLCAGQSHVTAPRDADETRRAYFAITPPRARGGGAAQPARRASRSARTSMRRARTSMRTRSPSRTSAIGPPTAASGA